jgi:excisionase family DNA binding protein
MKLTTKQFGEQVGLTDKRIIQLINSGVLPAEKIGRDYLIEDSFIPAIKARPEKRGRKPKINREVAA